MRLPDGGELPASRADLLTRKAEAVGQTGGELNGFLRAVRAGGWLILVGFVALAAGMTSSDHDELAGAVIAWTVVFVVIAGLASWRLLRHAIHGSRLARELRAWQEIDRRRSTRALPAGTIPEELLTIHDARDRDDLAEVAGRIRLAAQGKIYDGRLLWVGMLAVLPFVSGLVIVLTGFLGDDLPVLGRVCLVAGGGVVLGAACRTWWQVMAQAWHNQQDFNRAATEAELYLARRAALVPGVTSEKGPTLPAWARPLAGAVLLVLVLLLVARIASASAVALIIAAGILVLAALACVPPLVRRRTLRVVPLLAHGESVLEAPWRPVELSLDESWLTLAPRKGGSPVRVPATDLLGTCETDLGYPFAADAIGLLCRDEVIVVAGSRVRSHEVIRRLEQARAAQG